MTQATQRQISELLFRHGIKEPDLNKRGTLAGAFGGRIADIHVGRSDSDIVMTVMIGGTGASVVCPLTQDQAMRFVGGFLGLSMPASNASFALMVAHLLVKISDLYVDSSAETLTFEEVRLLPGSYHVGRVLLETVAPLHVAQHLAAHAHDRHARFNHRHGDSVKFPK